MGYLISYLVTAMHSVTQAELGRSLRISSLKVLDTANRIRKMKASFFFPFFSYKITVWFEYFLSITVVLLVIACLC